MTILNTGNLITADNIVPAVANLYDWSKLYQNSKLYAMLMQLGRVSANVPSGNGGAGNYQIFFNKATGMKTHYTSEGDAPEAAAGTFDLRSSNVNGSMDFDFSSAFTLVNIGAREGLALHFIGYVTDGAAATIKVKLIFRIESVTSASDITVKLIYTNLDTTAAYGTCSTLLEEHPVTGDKSYFLVTDIAEFGGEAPTADDMQPSQDSNYLQMYDVSYGKNLVAWSQLTKFDNQMATLLSAVEPRFNSSINADLLFGEATAPSATKDYGTMKGVWRFLNLDNPALNTDPAKPTIKVDTGTTIDLWNLVDTFADRTSEAPDNVLGVVTSEMDVLLLKAAQDNAATVRTEKIQFPRMEFDRRTIQIGRYTINLIVDDTLKYHPKMVDSSGNVAGRGKVGLFLSPKDMGIMFHDNSEYGVMVPAVRPVMNERDKRVKEAHMLACLTFGMWNMQNHVAYGITGSSS